MGTARLEGGTATLPTARAIPAATRRTNGLWLSPKDAPRPLTLAHEQQACGDLRRDIASGIDLLHGDRHVPMLCPDMPASGHRTSVEQMGRAAADAGIADDIERRILRGDLRPGVPLREVALAEHYGVARHTVKLALRELEDRALVRIDRNRGAAVRQLQRTEARDIFAYREILECGAIDHVVRDDAPITRLRRALERLIAAEARTAALAPDSRRRPTLLREESRRDLDVHAALVDCAGCARLTRDYAVLGRELRLIFSVYDTTDMPSDPGDHARLVTALERSDAAGAKRVLRRHLAAGLAHCLEVLPD